MLSAERKQLILQRISADGKVLASELSAHFGVSEDTIRRDLRELAEGGLLVRVHGGALPKSPVSPSYAVRREQSVPAKAAIARAAAALVRSGQVIAIDGGTTPLQVAEQFPPDLRATVVTHSLPVLNALAGRAGIELVVVGGRLLRDSLAAVGTVTVDAYRALRADVCVLGVAGLDVHAGVTSIDQEEAFVKRAMVDGSREVIAVASAEKLGTASPYVVAPAGSVTHLVTDKSVADEVVQPFEAAGTRVTRA